MARKTGVRCSPRTVAAWTALALAAVCSARAAAQSTGSTWRVSLGAGGVEADRESHNGVLSEDGRYVAFQSMATNLVPNDTNDLYDIFVHDLWTRDTTRANVGLGGIESNGSSCCPGWSRDGRYVCFTSSATNLVAGDTSDSYDAFVVDLQTGAIVRASIAWDGAEPDESVAVASISGDGSAVVFYSGATNLAPNDLNDVDDVFVRDLAAGTTTRVSVGEFGQEASGGSYTIFGRSVSDDGRRVVFTSYASNLVSYDTNNQRDVFLRDLQAGTTICISSPSPGVIGNLFSVNGCISGDGRFVAFTSRATNLAPGDTNNLNDVYVRDLVTGTIQLVSVSTGGAIGNGVSGSADISDDGLHVVFDSAANNLIAGDANGHRHMFLRDLAAGTTSILSLNTAGAPTDGHTERPRISGDARFVLFNSLATNLVPNDTNSTWDMFLRDTRSPDPAPYCVAKVNSQGCTPQIWSVGMASLTGAGLQIGAQDVINRKSGLLLYGFAEDAAPFGGGVLCVHAPRYRAGVQLSGGSPSGVDCSGAFAMDFGAFIRGAGATAFHPGRITCVQYYYRDPLDAFGVGLSDALSFPVLP